MYSEIGSKIKELRTLKNFTLKDLSERTNLSISFLSQLERGLTTVALDSLSLISDVLDVNLATFFEKPATNIFQPAVRSFEREVFMLESNQIIQYSLSQGIDNMEMSPRYVELMPKMVSENVELYSHNGEEFVYILEGILTYHLDKQKYDLFPGDSLHFKCTTPHNYENNTTKQVRFININLKRQINDSLK